MTNDEHNDWTPITNPPSDDRDVLVVYNNGRQYAIASFNEHAVMLTGTDVEIDVNDLKAWKDFSPYKEAPTGSWNRYAAGWRPIEEADQFKDYEITDGLYLVRARLEDVDYDEFKGKTLYGWVGVGCYFKYDNPPTHFREISHLPSNPSNEKKVTVIPNWIQNLSDEELESRIEFYTESQEPSVVNAMGETHVGDVYPLPEYYPHLVYELKKRRYDHGLLND